MLGPDGKVIFANYKPDLSRPNDEDRIDRRARAASKLCSQKYAALEASLQLATLKEHIVRVTKRLASGQFEAAMRDAQRSLAALRSLNRQTQKLALQPPVDLPATAEALKAKFNRR